MSLRAPFLALTTLAAALALGCGGSSSDHDAAASGQDLSSGEGCYAIAECAFACTAGDAACVQACIDKGTPVAQTAYAMLTTCGYGLCTGTDGGSPMGDGGSTACATATDTSAACTQCVQNGGQSTACASFVTTCANE
jgi:hypothetical protein